MSDMYLQRQNVCVSHSKLKTYILLLGILRSTDAVTLSGSSVYAVPGSAFTLTCDVPDEANSVQLYRRPDVISPVGILQVAGGQCYDTSTTPVLCSPDVCSCVSTSTLYGTVFNWVIQPRTADQDSVWFCSRTNPGLTEEADRIEDSSDYTLNVRSQTVSLAVTPPIPVVGQEVTLTCTVSPDITTTTTVYYRRDTRQVVEFTVSSTSCTPVKAQGGQNYTFTCGALPSRQLSLTIPAAYVTEDEHETDWRCNIFIGAISNTVQLRLSVPVSTVTMTSNGAYHPNVTITAGNTRTFSCTTSASRPVAEITWFRGDTNVTDQAGTVTDQDTGEDKYTRQQSLTITGRVNDADSELKCEAVNIQGWTPVSSQTSNIIVQWEPQVDPSLTRDPPTTTLTEGESVKLICLQTGGKPLGKLTWSGACGGMTMTDSSNTTTVTSSLQLSINRTYSGQACTCPPSPPTHVFADCKAYGSAEVTWRAGNNGGYTQSFQVLYKTDGASTVYPNTVTENGDDEYVITLDNLEEHSLHIFTILAFNSFGSVTSSEIGKCTVHEKPRPTENSTMFDAGVAMMCTGVIALLLTVGIIVILLKRKDTCLSRHQQTEPPVHLENMDAAGTFPPGDERTLYEKLDSDGRVQPSVYESIGKPSNSNDATAEQQQDSNAYETLHGRSQPNTYEELDSIDNERRRKNDCIDNRGADYINT